MANKNRKLTGYIHSYSKKTRDMVSAAAEKFLVRAGIDELSANLFSCVDELVKNAVKANYKFLLIRDRIYHKLSEQFPDKSSDNIINEIDDLVKVQESFDHIANDIISSENISHIVREILNEEAKYLNIKNRAYRENRNYTEAEKREIAGLRLFNSIRKKIRNNDIKIILKIEADKDYIYIEITNTAPILSKDLHRIYEKRDELSRYRDRGEEHLFFINNLDTSESGFGLGYAKIDMVLYEWGLDPRRAATIISSIDTTVMLTLPIEQLRRN